MSELTRCEQCGRTVSRADKAGWLYIGKRHVLASTHTVADILSLSASNPQPDLCTWECVRDYAIVQTLEPAPQEAP